VALKGQRIIHFSMDMGMGIISWGQGFSYMRIVSAVGVCVEWSGVC
jgi:hypothetical protein